MIRCRTCHLRPSADHGPVPGVEWFAPDERHSKLGSQQTGCEFLPVDARGGWFLGGGDASHRGLLTLGDHLGELAVGEPHGSAVVNGVPGRQHARGHGLGIDLRTILLAVEVRTE